jgi:enoyl-CoA hydratase/carnithine racemase
MGLGSVVYEARGGVASIVLRRPRVDVEMAQRLCDVAEEVELDDRIAVVVVQGRGKAFCLGVDGAGDWQRRHDWVAAIGRLTRPVVAAVNGDAVAEGCELALACDLRIASAAARFSLPQVAEGRLPSHGATQRLPRLVGRMRALDLLLSGRRAGAREAEAMGLVTRVVPVKSFAAAVRREVAVLSAKGPLALRLAKEAVTKGMDLSFAQGVGLEQDLYVLLQTTADRAEGVRAFLDKRRPRFRGA